MNAVFDQIDRVRRHTGDVATEEIDAKGRDSVRLHSKGAAETSRRIGELEREWDVERTLEANAATLALTGAVLGATVNKKWFWLTGGVLGFLFQHAASGWCPPLPILRTLGVRTQGEIDQERFALKAIRGDFVGTRSDTDDTVQAVTESESRTREHRREPDRVRRYTTAAQTTRIDTAMARRVRLYASQSSEVLSERIAELLREWSIERYLQMNVAVIGITTAALAASQNRKWAIATCAGLGFFLFHAIEGFDPPIPALRRAGIRTRAEIDQEIYALKILRGDFDQVPGTVDQSGRVEAALTAVGL